MRIPAYIDSAHKIVSPSTYECNLCDITFGTFVENKIWKNFREESLLEMEFLHKDEFKKLYASKFGYAFDYPIVLMTSVDNLEVFITTAELNALESAEELVSLIKTRI